MPIENATPPAIGPVYAGRPLQGSLGVFTNAASTVGQWLRGSVAIPGETGLTFTPDAGDVGTRIAFRVTATSPSGGVTVVTSPYTAPIEPDPNDDGDDDEGSGGIGGGGVVAGVIPGGVQTASSPATLSLHAALTGTADAITATVQTYGASPPANVSYAFSATGEVILLNTSATNGVRVTAMAPAVVVEADRDMVNQNGDKGDSEPRQPGQMHGAMVNFGLTVAASGPAAQGFDSGKPIKGGNSNRRVWSQAANVCPTKPGGVALSYLQGAGGVSISKARSIPGDVLRATGDGKSWRPLLRSGAVLTVTDSTLATGRGRPFRPAPGAASKALNFYQNDVSLTSFPSLATVASTPTADSIVAQLQFSAECAYGGSAGAERYHPVLAGSAYRSDRAELYGNAALLLCLNIPDADKRRILDGLVQIGIDTAQSVTNGVRWNQQKGLGGISAGSKLPIVIAALALNDAGLLATAQRTDFSSEDRQIVTVDADDVATWDYISDDLGMPEWQMNEVQNDKIKSRRPQGTTPEGRDMKTYRGVFNRHLLGQTLALRLITNGRATWNNQRVFDYADRVFSRNFYRDGSQPLNYSDFQVPSNSGSSFAWGLSMAGDNAPNAFQRAMYAAYRAGAGTIWNWS